MCRKKPRISEYFSWLLVSGTVLVSQESNWTQNRFFLVCLGATKLIIHSCRGLTFECQILHCLELQPNYFYLKTNLIGFCFICQISSLSFVQQQLPLASTRWIRSTFSSLCLLSSNQCRLSNIEIHFLECRESNLGPLGEKQKCYLYAVQPSPIVIFSA